MLRTLSKTYVNRRRLNGRHTDRIVFGGKNWLRFVAMLLEDVSQKYLAMCAGGFVCVWQTRGFVVAKGSVPFRVCYVIRIQLVKVVSVEISRKLLTSFLGCVY